MKTALLIIVALVAPVVAIAFWVLIKTAHQEGEDIPCEDGKDIPSNNGEDQLLDNTDDSNPQESPALHNPYEPKFIIGNCITDGHETYTIMDIKPNGYLLEGAPPLYLPFTEEDKWELASDGTGGVQSTINEDFVEMISRFSEIVSIQTGGITYQWLFDLWTHQDWHFWQKDLFPTIVDYFGTDAANNLIGVAWLYAEVLAELVPDKRDALYQTAYDYCGRGADLPVYGWSFDHDPNIGRMVAAAVYATTRDASRVAEMRKELGGAMLTYKTDISETYVDTRLFMPQAPGPSLDDKKNNIVQDQAIHETIAGFFNLDTKESEMRQQTIQAIANKEYKKPHLFGKSRTVTDGKYGQMTFNPVFGMYNIGVEIPEDGIIANLCYNIGKACSATRISLLNQEYGRRRPGQGEKDGSANIYPKQRALVNYAIEEGDGRTTGYYNQGGDYVSIDTGQHIGDYEAYCQNQLYANSYPSGHSAYIEGAGLVLMMIMPDKADVILKAINEYAVSRCICRYHWMSDTIHGRVIGTTMIPVLAATTNTDFENLLNKAKEEYQRILNGSVTPEPTPKPTPTEKVNTSLAYSIGGYGSCHVDAGEKSMVHACTKQCVKERHPSITVSQTVEFTIDGAGMTDINGNTKGVWVADKAYGLICPKVIDDQVATITMRNENGVRLLKYRLSKDGTHDDGPL